MDLRDIQGQELTDLGWTGPGEERPKSQSFRLGQQNGWMAVPLTDV